MNKDTPSAARTEGNRVDKYQHTAAMYVHRRQ